MKHGVTAWPVIRGFGPFARSVIVAMTILTVLNIEYRSPGNALLYIDG